MNELVKVRNVHKFFTRGSERIDVLKGVNLDIPAGDFLALMGPSGSGKTTLLNLIGGLDAPTEGEVEVAGVPVGTLTGGDLSRWRSQNIGFVFQLYNLLPVLTAEKNVELPLLLTKLSKAERKKRAGIALKVVGLAERAKHYPRQLSGGQEQRVGIARAIVTDRVDRRAITTGGADGDRVEVNSGLNAGERVVISPPAELSPGALVVTR